MATKKLSRKENQLRAAKHFKKMKEESANRKCVDCGKLGPQWASVSHGTLLCIECSGIHRSLGVHVSFVRSCTMDSWSDQQLAMMTAGGNANMLAFFEEQGFPSGLSPQDKYGCDACVQYRARVKALAKGGHPPPLPKIGYSPPVRSSPRTPTPTGSPSSMGGMGTPRAAQHVTMTGFGSNGQSHSSNSGGGSGGGDWFDEVSTSFFTAAAATATITKQAASTLAAKSQHAAAVLAEKSRTARDKIAERSKDQEVLGQVKNTVQQTSAAGWSAMTSLWSSAVTKVTELTSAAEEQNAFGVSRDQLGASKAMPGLGGGPASPPARSPKSSKYTGFGGGSSSSSSSSSSAQGKYTGFGSDSAQGSTGAPAAKKKYGGFGSDSIRSNGHGTSNGFAKANSNSYGSVGNNNSSSTSSLSSASSASAVRKSPSSRSSKSSSGRPVRAAHVKSPVAKAVSPAARKAASPSSIKPASPSKPASSPTSAGWDDDWGSILNDLDKDDDVVPVAVSSLSRTSSRGTPSSRRAKGSLVKKAD